MDRNPQSKTSETPAVNMDSVQLTKALESAIVEDKHTYVSADVTYIRCRSKVFVTRQRRHLLNQRARHDNELADGAMQ
jgi:hypothetical protein